MTKVFLPFALVFYCLQFFNCVSIDARPQGKEEKLAQLEKEDFRFTLPIAQDEPTRPSFPKVHKTILPNGLTVFVVEDKSLPIAQISLVFRNGSSRDPANHAGLINLSSLMLKEGTQTMNSLELAEAFSILGTEVSVSTSKDYSSFSTALLSNKVGEAISLLSSMAQHPRFDKDDYARVKLQQQSTVSSEQAEPSYLAQMKFLRTAYGDDHPYSYPSVGLLRTIATIELKDIKNAYKRYFGPNNAALIVVGDVSQEEVIKDAQKYFGGWQRIKHPLLAIKEPKARQKMQTVLVGIPNTPQTYLLVGQPAARRADKDLASYEVFLNILARDPTSRLNATLREEKGWTYGVKGVVNPLRGQGPLWIATSIQVPFGGEALETILEELEKLKTKPVSDAELKAAKDGILHSFASRYSTVSKVATQMAELFVYDLPLNNDQIFYDSLAKVSKADIMNIASKALKKDQMVAIAVGDLDAIETPLKKMDVGVVTIERGKISKPKAEEAKKVKGGAK